MRLAKVKLSDAIRAGCPLVPPTNGLTFRFDASGKEWAARRAHTKPLLGADAIGTALIGLVGDTGKAIERAYDYDNGPLAVIYGLYPHLTTEKRQCPACQAKSQWTSVPPIMLGSLLWHMTDVHSWTREQVADFLTEGGW